MDQRSAHNSLESSLLCPLLGRFGFAAGRPGRRVRTVRPVQKTGTAPKAAPAHVQTGSENGVLKSEADDGTTHDNVEIVNVEIGKCRA